MPYTGVHTIVDWSYTHDPVAWLRARRGQGGWLDDIFSNDDEFLVLRLQHSEFAAPYYRYGFDENFKTVGIRYTPEGRYVNAVYSLIGYYSLHDVLSPTLGQITYLPPPTRTHHILSPIRPVMAIQQVGDETFIQWDNLIVTFISGYDVDALVRSRNYGASTPDSTGQIDLLSPPGYDNTVTSSGKYMTSWETVTINNQKMNRARWSDGTETLTQINQIDNADKLKTYTVQETVKATTISYEEDGSKNTNTTDIFLQSTANLDNCRASSTASGSSAAEAFKGESGQGWLSADGDTTNVWLSYNFGSAGAVINKWRFMGHKTVPNCSPKRFRIEGSNSETAANWDVLYNKYENQVYKPLGLGEWSEWFTFSNGVSYRYYRLFILESYTNV